MANNNLQNNNGTSALDYAKRNNNEEIIKPIKQVIEKKENTISQQTWTERTNQKEKTTIKDLLEAGPGQTTETTGPSATSR
jgi:ankyrin repeat protein